MKIKYKHASVKMNTLLFKIEQILDIYFYKKI